MTHQQTPRVDGQSKVTGSAEYTADVALPQALWAKVLRSPHPHARIVRVDTTKARSVPGVHAVITGDDVSDTRYGRKLKDLPVLAKHVVRFVGEQVAAVAAVDKNTAERAAQLIEIDYEPLPAVFDPEEAATDSGVILHPEVHLYEGLHRPLDGPTNVFTRNQWGQGDVDAGFAEADVVIENTFTTSTVHQGYMETNNWLVWVDPDGRVQVWASNKTPYPTKQQISGAIETPVEQIVFNPTTIGGDFGGKGQARNIPLLTYLVRATGRPVRMVLEYTEELTAGNPRHPSIIHMRTGVKRNGVIVAHDVDFLFNSGAYAGFVPAAFVPGVSGAGGPYHIVNTRIVSRHVYTNEVTRGYMRGPGRVQATFALESQIDCVARALNMDPAELRRLNLARSGEANAIGEKYQDVRATEALDSAIKASGYLEERPFLVGRGLAMSQQDSNGGETHAEVALQPDGTVVLTTPVFEQGTGTYTILQQIVADQLGLPTKQVSVRVGDTDAFAFDSGMAAQRGARVGSQAAYLASRDAIKSILALAGDLLEWPEEGTTFDGPVLVRADTGERQPWSELVKRTGGPVIGNADVNDEDETLVTAFTAQVAEVRVDPETGHVALLRLTTVHDTGVILNPQGHQGQINGAAVQGLGYAMMEEIPTDGGYVTAPTLADFKIPSVADLPELTTVLLEPGRGEGPLGIKGIAENASSPVAAAIANAIEDAIGARIRTLPMTAERVYRALQIA